ncbi:MAG: hypothetical protein WCW52_07735 [Elusimicrobiales bacterium]|jgi:hypothetical protein
MNRLKNTFIVSLSLLTAGALPATLTPPAAAQDSQSLAETGEDSTAPAKKTPAKTAAKKKAEKAAQKKTAKKAKKKKLKTASEYKFEKVDSIPAYKFDKKANPIIKKDSPAKKTGKAGKNAPAAPKAGAAAQPQQKLNIQPPQEGGDRQEGLGEDEDQQQNPEE